MKSIDAAAVRERLGRRLADEKAVPSYDRDYQSIKRIETLLESPKVGEIVRKWNEAVRTIDSLKAEARLIDPILDGILQRDGLS